MTLLKITATLTCCGILLVGCSDQANQAGQAAQETQQSNTINHTYDFNPEQKDATQYTK